MKWKIIYTIAFLSATIFFLTNNASGPASVQGIDRTGSPLSPGTCATVGCHSDDAFDPSLAVELFRDEQSVTEYEPGEDYRIVATITAGTGSPEVYGLQMVALMGDDDANAGAFSVEDGMQVVTINDRDYAEHSSPSSSNMFELEWTAPPSGSGDVRFYAACNAANNNAVNTGDGSDFLEDPLVISEIVTSTAYAEDLSFEFTLYPNPVEDILNINVKSESDGNYEIHLMDLRGRILRQATWYINNGENLRSINISTLPAGNYIVRLSDGLRQANAKMLKN